VLSIAITTLGCIPSSFSFVIGFRGVVVLLLAFFTIGHVVILFIGVLVPLFVAVPLTLIEVAPIFASCYIPFLLSVPLPVPVPIPVPMHFAGTDAQP
jgi:hypothetical protein